jgi:hypothetical protein
MLETAVNEHGDSPLSECDIRPNRPALNPDRVVLAKSIAQAVEQRSQPMTGIERPVFSLGSRFSAAAGVPARLSSKDYQRKHIGAGPWVSAEVALTCDTVVTPSFLGDQRPS